VLYTENDGARARWHLENGVTSVITDHVDRVLAALAAAPGAPGAAAVP
jgi:hypothetical protein